jgi:large subunit ribosomal protein L21
MYAVIKSGGRQHRVAPGDRIQVEKLSAEAGSILTINEVLAVGGEGEAKIGTPTVADAGVKATVMGHGRGKKVIAFKYKRRKGFHKKIGHRQEFTTLRIDKVWVGVEPADPAPATEPAAAKEG